MAKYIIFSDGASRGNPGEAGIGIVIFSESGKKVKEIGEYIGVETNNVAEYKAMIKGLHEALNIGATEVELYADSELMVKQMKGQYKVKNEGLIPLYQEAKTLSLKFKNFIIGHVPREKNMDADRLANLGIDKKQEGKPEAIAAFKMPSLFGVAREAISEVSFASELIAAGKSLILRRTRLLRGSEEKHLEEKEKIIYLLTGQLRVITAAEVIELNKNEAKVLAAKNSYVFEALEESELLIFSSK